MGCCGSSAVIPIDEVAISIFGLDNAGKTSFLRALCGDSNFDTVPTVGLGQEHFMYDDIKLKVYDLGGNAQFRKVWQRFYAEIWGFIYVVDAADEDRFEESSKTLQEMIAHKMVKGKPFIVVANKQDKQGAIQAAALKMRFQMGRKVLFYDAVATQVEDGKCHEGVTAAVSALVAQILNSYPSMAKRREKDLDEQRQIDEKEEQEKRERLARRRAEMAAAQEANAAASPDPEPAAQAPEEGAEAADAPAAEKNESGDAES
jgi:ADP-ribosylation factor-like protein 13B